MYLPNSYVDVLTAEPQIVTVFGDRDFTEVIKVPQDHVGEP